ncbi:hypothetical protein BJV78DRAFT_1158716 [Lactifluus subvellereus]|nr:hypothetical protein BJV78DRAFT_1158716 [Lactifluus subvellereus]
MFTFVTETLPLTCVQDPGPKPCCHRLALGSFSPSDSSLPLSLFAVSRHLLSMPITRRLGLAAVGADKSAPEDNHSPPAARRSNRRAQATTTAISESKKTCKTTDKFTSEVNCSPSPAPAAWQSSRKAQDTTAAFSASKLKKTRASKKAAEMEDERNQARQPESADTQPQPSAPDTALIEPSEAAYSRDEVDELVSIPCKAKSPVPQQTEPSTPQSPNRATSGGVPQIPDDVTNRPANNTDSEGGEDLPMHNGNTETSSQDDDDDHECLVVQRSEGQGHAEDQGCEARLDRDDSPIERIRHPTSDTGEEDDDNDNELADKVDPEPSPLASDPQAMAASSNTRDDDEDEDELADSDAVDRELNSPQTTAASSSKGKGKGKAPLKCGPLSAEDKEEIHVFSTQVLEMAQDLADHLRTSRRNVLISASLGIKESRNENITNLYSQWYAATHTKPDRMSGADYARHISANYHKLVDAMTEDERNANLKEVRDWAASRETFIDQKPGLKSITTRILSIRDKFTSLSQSVENLYDIVVIGALLYVGDDAAGCQLSSLFTGSPIVRQLIDKNEVNVREILDRLTVAVK